MALTVCFLWTEMKYLHKTNAWHINGNSNGMLIEACVGLLDKDNPEDCIKRETEEETGYKVTAIRKIFEAYMSPGSVTEILYFFIAEYTASMRAN